MKNRNKNIRTRAYKRSHVFHYAMDPLRPEYLDPSLPCYRRCGFGRIQKRRSLHPVRLAWEYGDDPDLQVAGAQREVMDTKGRFLYDPSFDGSDFIRIYEEAQNKRSYTTTGSALATE